MGHPVNIFFNVINISNLNMDLNICSSDFLVKVQKFWSGTENLVRVHIFLSGYRFSHQVQKFSSSSESWWWKVSWSAIKSSINYVVIFCYKNSTTVNHWDLVKSFHHQFSELDENFCTWRDFLYLDKKICALTKKSVPWQENLYLDEKICTLTRKSVPDKKIWATDVHVLYIKLQIYKHFTFINLFKDLASYTVFTLVYVMCALYITYPQISDQILRKKKNNPKNKFLAFSKATSIKWCNDFWCCSFWPCFTVAFIH